nr:EOG090X06K9 [Lepidurus arcticus]
MTFVVVLTHLTALDPVRGYLVNTNMGPGPLTVGLAYVTCSLVALPSTGASFNPMRSLGPAFVMNKWDSHWIYWIGPIIGGCLAGLLYEFVFNPYRGTKKRKDSIDGDSLSMHSDEDFDEEKNGRQLAIANFQNARTQHYDQYRPALRSNPVSPTSHMASNAALASRSSRPDRGDPIYDGSKSLYCKTPQVAPKAILNRSQSVYTKPPLPPANPSPPLQSGLAPAQSMYLGKVSSQMSQQHHPLSVPSRTVIHRNESVYGMHRERESPYGAKITDNYGPISPPSNYADQKSSEENYLNSFPASKSGNPASHMYKPPMDRESYERSEPMYTHKPREQMPYGDTNGNGSRMESVYGMQGAGHGITQESIYATKKLEPNANNPPQMGHSDPNNYAMYPRSASLIRNDSVYGVVPPIRRPTPPMQTQMMNSGSNMPVNSPSPADTSKDSAYGSQYGGPMDHELLNRPPSHGSYTTNMNKMRVPLSSQDQAAVLKKVIRLDQEILGQKELQRQLTVRLEDLKKTQENSRENLLLLKKLLDQYELQTAGAEDGLQKVDSSVELQTKVVALNPDRNANPVIPVLVIACNRPSVQRCLDRLIKARLSSDQFPIIVSQDCGNEPTAEIIRSYETQIISIQQPDLSEPEVPDNHKRLVGYYKLSRHYSWALNQVFDKYNSSAVIIVEDDLEVGDDFYSYFQATLPILEADPSLWCVSAWNDNGKESLIDSSSPDLLHRSDFFPGLGWMMTRKLWETELKNKWPKAFWDDWMRNPEQRKERTCIRPEISRTRTFGKVGVSKYAFLLRKKLNLINLKS